LRGGKLNPWDHNNFTKSKLKTYMKPNSQQINIEWWNLKNKINKKQEEDWVVEVWNWRKKFN